VQDAIGGWQVFVDAAVYFSGAPTVMPNALYQTMVECSIERFDPPKATAVQKTGGNTSLGSNTSFSLSVPYNGITTWDTAVDGPLTIDGPYDGYVIPLGSELDITTTLWGGGASGETDVAFNKGTQPGGASSFDGAIAGGGQFQSGAGASGGPGGVASGTYDSAVNGNNGQRTTDPTIAMGAGAPNGGGNTTAAFQQGTVPGGGGAAPSGMGGGAGLRGGGSGAKTIKASVIIAPSRLIVGDGGVALTGPQPTPPGNGRAGRAIIS
jgi:hypothetical protein